MENDTWLLCSETNRERRLLSHQPASDLWTGQWLWGPAATFPLNGNQCWHKNPSATAAILVEGAELYVTFLLWEIKTIIFSPGATYSELYCWFRNVHGSNSLGCIEQYLSSIRWTKALHCSLSTLHWPISTQAFSSTLEGCTEQTQVSASIFVSASCPTIYQ